MTLFKQTRLKKKFQRAAALLIAATFFLSNLSRPSWAAAQSVLGLPVPGTMVFVSESYVPAVIQGMSIYPDHPLKFDFIFDSGDSGLAGVSLKDEAGKQARYFFAALTVPEGEAWVNLSPYEKEQMIPENFGATEMGRDLLAQDYLLKQLMASLMYPDSKTGGEFWKRVYEKTQEQYGSINIPVNTFNKVWIVPDSAVVYQEGNSAFVVESHLKVMLDQDYLSMQKNMNNSRFQTSELAESDVRGINTEVAQIVRDILIPEIEREVNEGKTFANLRQIYHAAILAAWYKKNLRQSLLGQVYVDRNKVSGVDVEDKSVNEQIYQQYLESFKKGVYDYLREEQDPATRQTVVRQHFSGGDVMNPTSVLKVQNDRKELTSTQLGKVEDTGIKTKVTVEGVETGPQSSKEAVEALKKFHVKIQLKDGDWVYEDLTLSVEKALIELLPKDPSLIYNLYEKMNGRGYSISQEGYQTLQNYGLMDSHLMVSSEVASVLHNALRMEGAFLQLISPFLHTTNHVLVQSIVERRGLFRRILGDRRGLAYIRHDDEDKRSGHIQSPTSSKKSSKQGLVELKNGEWISEKKVVEAMSKLTSLVLKNPMTIRELYVKSRIPGYVMPREHQRILWEAKLLSPDPLIPGGAMGSTMDEDIRAIVLSSVQASVVRESYRSQGISVVVQNPRAGTSNEPLVMKQVSGASLVHDSFLDRRREANLAKMVGAVGHESGRYNVNGAIALAFQEKKTAPFDDVYLAMLIDDLQDPEIVDLLEPSIDVEDILEPIEDGNLDFFLIEDFRQKSPFITIISPADFQVAHAAVRKLSTYYGKGFVEKLSNADRPDNWELLRALLIRESVATVKAYRLWRTARAELDEWAPRRKVSEQNYAHIVDQAEQLAEKVEKILVGDRLDQYIQSVADEYIATRPAWNKAAEDRMAAEKISSPQGGPLQETTDHGGVDLNPVLMDLQIVRDGRGVPLPLNQQPISTMEIRGLVPVIINIVPVNIPMILGLSPTGQQHSASREEKVKDRLGFARNENTGGEFKF